MNGVPLALGAVAALSFGRKLVGSRSSEEFEWTEEDERLFNDLREVVASSIWNGEQGHQFRSRILDLGLEHIGAGGTREVYSFPRGRVVKIPYSEGEVLTNLYEAETWNEARGGPAEPYLVPVIRADEEGLLLVMPRVRILRVDDPEDPEFLGDEAFHLGGVCVEDSWYRPNWGRHQGRWKLLDYPRALLQPPRGGSKNGAEPPLFVKDLAQGFSWPNMAKWARENGLTWLGSGQGRDVYRLPDGRVLKVATTRTGFLANQAEVRIWAEVQNRPVVRAWFLPVLWSSPSKNLLLVPLVRPIGLDRHTGLKELYERFVRETGARVQDWGKAENWGVLDGRPVLVDYEYARFPAA